MRSNLLKRIQKLNSESPSKNRNYWYQTFCMSETKSETSSSICHTLCIYLAAKIIKINHIPKFHLKTFGRLRNMPPLTPLHPYISGFGFSMLEVGKGVGD